MTDLDTRDAIDPRRGRAPMVIGAVGLVAVLVGLVVGRSASSAERSPATTTTVSRRNLTEPIPTVGAPPGASLPAVESTTTTTSVPPQTVPALGPFAGSAVGVAVPLAGQPIEIVAIGNGRQLLRIDLATGQYREQPAPVQPFGRPRVLATLNGLLFPSTDSGVPATLMTDDGTEVAVDLGPDLLVDPAGLLWRLGTTDADRFGVVVEPVTVDGQPQAPPIELPTAPLGFDPAGGFVVETVGGTYRVDAVDRERITTGTLVALDAWTVVATECDEALACALVVIDRATGDRIPLPGVPRSLRALPGWTIGADGQTAIVEVLDPIDRASTQPTLGVLDLVTGAVAELGPAQNIDEAIWTPDGRFVLYNRGGRVVAHELATGDEFVVADELIAIDTFEVRASR